MATMHDRDLKAQWAKERNSATLEDALDFISTIARLEKDGLKATFKNLPAGLRAEAARQIAKKKGWCVTGVSQGLRGVGWVLTEKGREAIAQAQAQFKYLNG